MKYQETSEGSCLVVTAMWTFLIACVILCSLIFGGCASKRQIERVVVEKHDTLIHNVQHTDSIYIRDSVAMWMAGDTIYKYKWKTEYRDRWKDKVQEVIRVQTDTCYIEKVKEVKPKITLWQRTKDCLLILLIVFVFFSAIKRLFERVML